MADLKAFDRALASMDQDVAEMVQRLWFWYSEEVLSSIEVLRDGRTQASVVEKRDSLRTFMEDVSSACSMASARWMRLSDAIALASMLGKMKLRRAKIEPSGTLYDVADRIEARIQAVLGSPPSGGLDLMTETADIQGQLFLALGMASQEFLGLCSAK